jgi:hypothetical protein
VTLATKMVEFLDQRAARDASRAAARAARDTFIQTQFPLLNARLIDLLRIAVGLHSQVTVTTTTQTLQVTGHLFATLPQTVATVSATIDTQVSRVTFAPVLDFRAMDRFGLVGCAPDFEATPRRSRAGTLASHLLQEGIEMRGTTSAHLLVSPEGLRVELSVSHLEDALAALFFR